MSGIHTINTNSNNYLIEPTLYTTASIDSGVAFTSTLTNFELFSGVAVNVEFTANVPADATLNISSTGAKIIKYANNNIKANILLANHIYTLIYDGTNWLVVNELSNGTYLPLTGGTITGNLIQTAGYIYGESSGSNPNHAIKLGHASDDKMNFYEYGGVFNWYKSRSGTNTLLMNLNGDTLTVANLAGNASSASQVSASLATTTKTFLLGTSTTLTSSAANVSLIGDTGVYLTDNANTLSAGIYSWNISGVEKAHTVYNSTDDTIDFVFD